jgi:hypothetical protein
MKTACLNKKRDGDEPKPFSGKAESLSRRIPADLQKPCCLTKTEYSG